jgi:hypothetical protein
MLLNNERTDIRLPGSKSLLDFEHNDVVRPQAKELLTSFKSFTTMQNFFRTGGGASSTSSPHNQDQMQDKTIRRPQEDTFDIQLSSQQNMPPGVLLQKFQTLFNRFQYLFAATPQDRLFFNQKNGSKKSYAHRGKKISDPNRRGGFFNKK